jgi:hypothetical protein
MPVFDEKPTPGPWAWYRREVAGVEEATELRSPRGQVLCIDLPEFIAVADKRLIAAAPDLLEALTVMLRSANPNRDDHPAMWSAWGQARAAIAKAEGRP